MKPFFSYYGSKWRAFRKYPNPQLKTIIEPFCGSAGYSIRYFEKNVILNDLDPIIYGVWDYLIKTSSKEILKLPKDVDHVDNLKCCQEAKWLIGFWLNSASVSPKKSPSKWMRDYKSELFWGDRVILRIASQIEFIKHWKIFNKSFENIENQKATWFFDPPYNNHAGSLYRFGSKNIDFGKLKSYTQSREGQVIVCENLDANWLPFKSIGKIRSTRGTSNECLFQNKYFKFGDLEL